MISLFHGHNLRLCVHFTVFFCLACNMADAMSQNLGTFQVLLKIGGACWMFISPCSVPEKISSLLAQDQISFAQQELAKTQKTQVRWIVDEGNSYPSWFHGKSGKKWMIWGYHPF
jgi:hypothetical protein